MRSRRIGKRASRRRQRASRGEAMAGNGRGKQQRAKRRTGAAMMAIRSPGGIGTSRGLRTTVAIWMMV
eukprot:8555241-Alexandrium_andersonii.AAC.1